ncbi:LANO_0G10770g1_1 [Lachancea nothofagi CBS 11611]|uniref:Autophagy-related protein 14 n=1 Tax=Lachancea nothofagi CBS 11611 TaxID=1266666 RepID=A0A1G4KIZ9_9SACH|nr:LANO_0G10770g1_1 [Lachancea nothofagi CBS 11611]
MVINCCACHKQSKALYCGHCINTSPSLLLKRKIELYQIRASNEQLRVQVDKILECAMNDASESQDVLGKHLSMLKTTHLKRKTNKFRLKVGQVEDMVIGKRERVRHLQRELQQKVKKHSGSEPWKTYSESPGDRFQSFQAKLKQLQKVLVSSKSHKFQELVRLFLIRQRAHPEFPYTISFQPVVNVQNLYRLPQNVIECSLRSMWEFLLLAGRILLVELPLKKPTKDVLDNLAGIVLNLLVLLLSLKLIPQSCSDKRVLLRNLLRDYDVDKLFYCLVTNKNIETDCKSKIETIINHDVCHAELQSLLQGSSELSVLNKSMDDKWFLVG